jgi:glycosyltransferase involved in cell wall biosynthesis
MFVSQPFRDDLFDYSTPLRVGWVGNTEPGLFAEIKGLEQIKKACAGMKNIRFAYHDRREHGLLTHSEMPNFYKMFDCIVCFSASECTPNPVLEANSSGRPWISTDVGIVAELLQDAHQMGFTQPPGLVIPREKYFLQRAMTLLSDDREKLVSMGGCGYQVATERWSWQRRMGQFREALNEVMR